jgi:hypothetical protein
MGFSSTFNPQPIRFVRTFSGHRAAGGILRTLPLTAARSGFLRRVKSGKKTYASPVFAFEARFRMSSNIGQLEQQLDSFDAAQRRDALAIET